MKKKLLYALIPALGLAAAIGGTSIASANGFGGFGFGFGWASSLSPEQAAARQAAAFQKEAEILGISVADLKDVWADGKSFDQIIQEKDLNRADIENRAKKARLDQIKSHLQSLVSQGVITQSQADRRLSAMQNLSGKNGRGKMMGRGSHMMGMMGMMGF